MILRLVSLIFLFGFLIIGCGVSVKKHKKEKETERAVKTADAPNSYHSEVKGDSILVQWRWMDYNKDSYSISFALSKKDVANCKRNRLKLRLSPLVKNCPDYASLVRTDLPVLKPIAEKLKQMAKSRQLDEKRTAELVVSMIQNIVYTLVHPYSHKEMENIDKQSGGSFISEYHSESDHKPFDMMPYGGCEERVDPAGIYSPVEFLSTFRGDCDTRTVTCFALLKLMDLQSIVANGPGHSMLTLPYAPANPAAPHLNYMGQNFYFVETTVFFVNGNNVGPQIGDVPADFNSNQWFPVLI
jgi:hypothetical protein